MSRSSHISSKGQITIPIEIRHRLGLKTGDTVEFAIEKGQTILRPARSPENLFEKFAGALPEFSNIEQIHSWVRSLRDPQPDSTEPEA